GHTETSRIQPSFGLSAHDLKTGRKRVGAVTSLISVHSGCGWQVPRAPSLEARQLGAFYRPQFRRRLSPVSRGVLCNSHRTLFAPGTKTSFAYSILQIANRGDERNSRSSYQITPKKFKSIIKIATANTPPIHKSAKPGNW